jgi:hypothetical protein
MASTYSSLLKVELIGTGDQSGTWGTTTNLNLGTILESAIAGTATVDVTAGNVTLTSLDGAADQARCMILKAVGTAGVTRNIIAPASSKVYVVLNESDASIVLKGSSTTGISIASGARIFAAWDGSDFVEITSSSVGSGDVTGPASATADAIALFNGTTGKIIKNSGVLLPSGTLVGTSDAQVLTNKTINGANNTLSNISLTSQVTGTLPVANGGTGGTTFTGLIKGNGSSAMSVAVAGTDYLVPGGALGTPSSGTLSSCTVDGTNAVGYRNVPPAGTKTTSYILATGDVGKYVQVGSGGSVTIPNSTFAEGDVISVFNNTTSSITITCSISTAYIAGFNTAVASVSVATRGIATILFTGPTSCVVSGNVS